MSSSAKAICRFFVALAIVAFILNWFWEMAQMRAFVEMATASWTTTLVPCTFAALGDVILTFLVYGVGALLTRRSTWGLQAQWRDFALAAIAGGTVATAYEWLTQFTGRWTYTVEMPIVPVIGVGLWPLMQLTIITPISIWIASLTARTTAGRRISH